MNVESEQQKKDFFLEHYLEFSSKVNNSNLSA